MNNKLSVSFVLTALLSLIFLAGCGADDELRYPDAPVVDLIFEREIGPYFDVGIVASEPVPYTMGMKLRLTFRGYLMNDDRDPFESTDDKLIASLHKGERYKSLSYRKELDEYWANWHHGLELDITGIAHRPGTVIAVVTSLTIDLYPYAFDDSSPIFNVGVGSLTMESTETRPSLR